MLHAEKQVEKIREPGDEAKVYLHGHGYLNVDDLYRCLYDIHVCISTKLIIPVYQCKFKKWYRVTESFERKKGHTQVETYPHILFLYTCIEFVLCIVLLLSLFLCISYMLVTLYVASTPTPTRQVWRGCPWLIMLLMMLRYVWLLWLARSTCCWTLTLGLSWLMLVWAVGLNADSGYVDCLGHVEGRDFLENGSCEIGTSKVGMLKLTASQITILGKKKYFKYHYFTYNSTLGWGGGDRERGREQTLWLKCGQWLQLECITNEKPFFVSLVNFGTCNTLQKAASCPHFKHKSN